MAFNATIQSINYQNDSWVVSVVFNDTVSGWTASKTYSLPAGTTQATAVAQITIDGTAYKAALVTNAALQSKVGTIIVI